MSARNPPRGMSPQTLGQGVVIAAAICAAWIIWSESRDRGWIPGLAQPPANPIDLSRQAPVQPRAPVSIPPLIEELSNDFAPHARRQALLQLSSIGPPAAEAIDAIRERLQDEDAGVRYAAVLAITRVCQDPDVFLPELRATLDDPNSGVRDVAVEMLAGIGRPATGLAIELLNREAPATRSRALSILRRIVCPETFPEISAAIEKLNQDPNADVQSEALVALVDWGMIDHAGIRVLLRTNRTIPGVRPRIDLDRNSREIALQAITWLGPEAADLVVDLVALLEELPDLEITATRTENDRQIQYRSLAPGVRGILSTLSALKTVARPAAPYLLGRLKGLDRYSQAAVIGTLSDIGAEPEMLKSALSVRVAEAGYYTGLANGKLLVRADPETARRQVAELIEKLSDPNKLRDEKDFGAIGALAGFGPEAKGAVPVLTSLLSDTPSMASYWATIALGQIGPDAAPAVPRLIANLERARRDGNFPQGRHHEKFESLRDIGPAAQDAVPVLLAILNDPKPAVPAKNGDTAHEQDTSREYAVSALGKIAIDSPEVNLAIRRQLSSESAVNRAVAARALANSKQNAPRVLTEIIALLKNDAQAFVRAHAAIAIGELAGDRQAATVPLSEALGDSDPIVREAAAFVLGAMGPAAKSALPALHHALLEARCGLPVVPFPPAPAVTSFALLRDSQPVPQRLLVQALLKALRDIDQAE